MVLHIEAYQEGPSQQRRCPSYTIRAASRALLFWCSHVGCPQHMDSDSGFEGWPQKRFLQGHLLTHAQPQAEASQASTGKVAGTEVPSRNQTVPMALDPAIARIQGRLWCPSAPCRKEFGRHNAFGGYSTRNSLQSHVAKDHRVLVDKVPGSGPSTPKAVGITLPQSKTAKQGISRTTEDQSSAALQSKDRADTGVAMQTAHKMQKPPLSPVNRQRSVHAAKRPITDSTELAGVDQNSRSLTDEPSSYRCTGHGSETSLRTTPNQFSCPQMNHVLIRKRLAGQAVDMYACLQQLQALLLQLHSEISNNLTAAAVISTQNAPSTIHQQPALRNTQLRCHCRDASETSTFRNLTKLQQQTQLWVKC